MEAKAAMESGALVSDDLVVGIISERSLRSDRCPEHVAGRKVTQAVILPDGWGLGSFAATRGTYENESFLRFALAVQPSLHLLHEVLRRYFGQVGHGVRAR